MCLNSKLQEFINMTQQPFQVFSYPVIIKEIYLDSFGHVNNAAYMTLFEEARWELVTNNGYGIKKIKETGIGPILLEAKLNFLKELRARDEVNIVSESISYNEKIYKLSQKMIRAEEVCCSAEFTIALFSWKEHKIILPTPDWLKALGMEAPA